MTIEVVMYGCIANVGHIQCMCHWCGQYATYHLTKEEDILNYRYGDPMPTDDDLKEYSADTMNCAMCIICQQNDAFKITELCTGNEHIAEIQSEDDKWCVMYIKTDMIVPDVCIKYFPPIYNVELRPKIQLDMDKRIDECIFEHFTARLSMVCNALHVEKRNSRFIQWDQIIKEIALE